MNNLIGIDGDISLSKSTQNTDTPVQAHNYFFRDHEQMNLIRTLVLPRLIAAKRKQNNLSLRIWSAGCASGEELFSIAIMLWELIPDISAWTIHLLGTDIDTNALKTGVEAIYPEQALKDIETSQRKRWFQTKENGFQITKDITKKVEFAFLNLETDVYPCIINGTNAQDLILCRDVLCLFPTEKAQHIMKKLNLSLIEGGFLILGNKDPIETNGTDLIFHHHSGLLFERPNSKEYQIKTSMNFTHNIPINTKIITELLNASRWQEAIDAIQIYKYGNTSAFLNFAEATGLANLGELTKATELCKQSIHLDPNHKETHLLLAMIYIELCQLDEAEQELKKVMLLDEQYVIAYYELALLQLRRQQIEAAICSLAKALAIATAQPASHYVPGGSGITYQQLTDILQHEVELHTPK